MVLPLLRVMSVTLVVLCLLNPQRVEVIQHRQNGRLAVLLDASRSMGINDIPGTRLVFAKSWVRNKVLPAVPTEATLSLYSFDRSLAALSDLTLVSPEG